MKTNIISKMIFKQSLALVMALLIILSSMWTGFGMFSFAEANSVSQLKEINIDERNTVKIDKGEHVYLEFSPHSTGWYYFYSYTDSGASMRIYENSKEEDDTVYYYSSNNEGDYLSLFVPLSGGEKYKCEIIYNDNLGKGDTVTFDIFVDCIKKYCSHQNSKSIENIAATCYFSGYKKCEDCEGVVSNCGDWNNKFNPHIDEDNDNICEVCNSEKKRTHTDENIDGLCDFCDGIIHVDEGKCGGMKINIPIMFINGYYWFLAQYYLYPDGVLEIYGKGEISKNAFEDNEKIKNIFIKEGIVSIGEGAFSGCSNLKNVTISDYVKYIGKDAFDSEVVIYCTENSYAAVWAKENNRPYVITDGSDEENIFSGKFGKLTWTLDKRSGFFEIKGNGEMVSFGSVNTPWHDYSSFITEVVIHDGVTSIGDYAFKNCYNIKNVIITDGVKTIGQGAFIGCCNMEEITMPDKAITIGNSAFYNCDSIKSVTISDSVKSIGESAFGSCDSLEKVVIGGSITSIGSFAFEDSENINAVYAKNIESWLKITYGDGEDGIATANPLYHGADLYFDSKLAVDIEIPESITEIKDFAFYNCDSIKSVTISDNVKTIGESAFRSCDSLESVSVGNTVEAIGYSMFRDCKSLKNVTIGNSVLTICEAAFFDCESLDKVIIPYNVKNINNDAFHNCTNLAEIVVFSTDCNFDENCGFNYNQKIYGYVDSTAEVLAEKVGAEFIDIESIHTHEYVKYEVSAYCSYEKCWCGKTNVKPHAYISDVAKQSTCSEEGIKIYTCICGDTYTEIIPKTNHSLGDWYVAKYGTCNTATVLNKKCKNCSYKEEKLLSTSGVHIVEKVIAKATDTHDGKVVTSCSVCGVKISSTTINQIASVKLSSTKYICDGKTKTPSVIVKDSKGNTLKKDIDYSITYSSDRSSTGKYNATVKFKGNYGGSEKLSFTIIPATPSGVKYTASSTKTLKLSWKAVVGATGYIIYRYNLNTKKYSKIAIVDDKTSYSISSLKSGTAYKFKVKAYAEVDEDSIYTSNYSSEVVAYTKPATPTLKVKSTTKGKATLTWTNVSGESGYEVYYSTKKSSGFKKCSSPKANVTKLTVSKLKSGKTYYFKVRAYTKTANGTVYGEYRTVSVKVK